MCLADSVVVEVETRLLLRSLIADCGVLSLKVMTSHQARCDPAGFLRTSPDFGVTDRHKGAVHTPAPVKGAIENQGRPDPRSSHDKECLTPRAQIEGEVLPDLVPSRI